MAALLFFLRLAAFSSLAVAWTIRPTRIHSYGHIAFSGIRFHACSTCLQSAPSSATDSIQQNQLHVVNGITCREVPMELPKIGTVFVLEATAESQDELVELAVLLDGEDVPTDRKEHAQTLNAGDPYGAVLWPAAWAVSKYLLEECDLKGLTVLELGTGTGLVSIAAALGGAGRVLATDYEDLALHLTRYAARRCRADVRASLLDMCDRGAPLPPADLVVAADVMYERNTGAALAERAVEALRRGSRVIVGDSPGRAGRPYFLEGLRKAGITDPSVIEAIGKTCTGPRNELICGKGSTSVSETAEPLEIAIYDLSPSLLTGESEL